MRCVACIRYSVSPAYAGIDLLARDGRRLSEVVDGLPKVHLTHDTVVTPWEQKGMVMRSLVEMSKDREVELISGPWDFQAACGMIS